jgi:hypothetical protein
VSKRSRKRRALPSGALGPRPGFGPGEPHGPGADDPPFDDPSGGGPFGDDPWGDGPFGGGPFGDGGVREPRRPKPAPPSMTMEAPPPEPPLRARDRTLPPPHEVTSALAPG